jgi:uncharacterized protein YegL
MPSPSESSLHNRRKLWIAASLLAITAAVGIGARAAGDLGTRASGSPSSFEASSGPFHFSGRLDRGSILQGGDGLVKMELVLRADAPVGLAPPRLPTDLVVVLDRSGSMRGAPLASAQSAIRELISGLASDDRFSLVSYASDSRVEISLADATAAARVDWHSRIDRVSAEGGTNMSAGLDAGIDALLRAQTAGRAPRVILLSDGHANQGDYSLEGLRARAQRAVTGEFVLSTVGVGLGFDEHLMGHLADAGTGNFYFFDQSVDGSVELAEVFAGEFESAREMVAQAVTVEITPSDGVEVIDAAGYPIEAVGALRQFRLGALHAGQERKLWVTLRAPDGAIGEVELGRFAVGYRESGRSGSAERRVLSFGTRPRIARVARATDYYAAIDPAVFEDGLVSDGLNQLKQSVSRKVRAGDSAGALSEIQEFEQKSRVVYRHIDRDAEQSVALKQALELRSDVQDALAPAASPERAQRLSKKLQADGTDGRRAGAKKNQQH